MEEAQRVVLVTGAAGMLGGQLVHVAPAGVQAVAATRADGDLADPDQVESLFARTRPDAVMHAAGFTEVDRAEESPDDAHRGNVLTTRAVAAAANHRGIPFLVLSTDYVFDGAQKRPYREDDAPNPLSVYAKTKLQAEREAEGGIIVRTGWLYGPLGVHFPGKIAELGKTQEELKVVDDQRGSPTSTLELAPVLWELLLSGAPGIYHATCEGDCTWFELADSVVAATGGSARVVRCTTDEFPRPAPRPAYSVLDCTRLAERRGKRLAPWREALERFLRIVG